MSTLLLITRLEIRAGGGGALSTILDSLRDGAFTEAKRDKELRASISSEYHDFVDDEWARFERAAYGAAFVTYQPYIHDVAAAAMEVRKHLGTGKPKQILPDTPTEIMNLLGSPSEILKIHTLANYVKHAESWAANEWQKPSFPTTINVLKQMGFTKSYPDLVRDGARKLNIPSPHMIGDLSTAFDDWSRNVVEAARGDAGLPPRHRVGT